MPDKYYVILESQNGDQFTFPMKAPTNQFVHMAVQFAGGNPAFFGGTANGRDARTTIEDETAEESRGSLVVHQGAALKVIKQITVGGDNYTFYWTRDWSTTGTVWGPPTSFETGEMSRIATHRYADFSGYTGSPDQILNRLLELTKSPTGTPLQAAEFRASETAAAFVQQILDTVAEEDND